MLGKDDLGVEDSLCHVLKDLNSSNQNTKEKQAFFNSLAKIVRQLPAESQIKTRVHHIVFNKETGLFTAGSRDIRIFSHNTIYKDLINLISVLLTPTSLNHLQAAYTDLRKIMMESMDRLRRSADEAISDSIRWHESILLLFFSSLRDISIAKSSLIVMMGIRPSIFEFFTGELPLTEYWLASNHPQVYHLFVAILVEQLKAHDFYIAQSDYLVRDNNSIGQTIGQTKRKYSRKLDGAKPGAREVQWKTPESFKDPETNKEVYFKKLETSCIICKSLSENDKLWNDFEGCAQAVARLYSDSSWRNFRGAAEGTTQLYKTSTDSYRRGFEKGFSSGCTSIAKEILQAFRDPSKVDINIVLEVLYRNMAIPREERLTVNTQHVLSTDTLAAVELFQQERQKTIRIVPGSQTTSSKLPEYAAELTAHIERTCVGCAGRVSCKSSATPSKMAAIAEQFLISSVATTSILNVFPPTNPYF